MIFSLLCIGPQIGVDIVRIELWFGSTSVLRTSRTRTRAALTNLGFYAYK